MLCFEFCEFIIEGFNVAFVDKSEYDTHESKNNQIGNGKGNPGSKVVSRKPTKRNTVEREYHIETNAKKR